SPRPPTMLTDLAVVLEPSRSRVWVIDGSLNYGPDALDAVWQLNLTGDTRWQRVVAAGPAFRRSGASAMLDDARHRILVYGGVDHGVAQNDVWSLSLDDAPTWTVLAPGGTPPPAQPWRQAVLDSDNDRLLVMGDSTVWAL